MESQQNAQVRQQAIVTLLQTEPISDQQEFIHHLKEKFNISTNQAVVSRDLRKLGIVKKQVKDVFIYEMPHLNVKEELLKLAVIDVIYNEALIVVKTHDGLAAFVGDCLDQNSDLKILGSIAGENVVFVTPISIPQIKQVYGDICKQLHFKKNK